MKTSISIVLLLSVAAWFFLKASPVTFSFANAEWHFPSTVGEAVEAHGLSYKPPGYYYRIYPDSMKLVLRFDALSGIGNRPFESPERAQSL